MASRTDDRQVTPAQRQRGYFDLVVVLFCSLLLISNISAVKPISLDLLGPLDAASLDWHVVIDGGAFLFPFTYILGDLLAEVYGLRAARRAIAAGFAVSVLASVCFLLVDAMPALEGWPNDAAFGAVLGFVPRIVIASLAGYLVGQLLNAYVLVRIKRATRERALWARLIGSTLVGELFDTVVFCTVAFAGVITGADFLNYVFVGYLWKCAVEVILLPVTYAVIGWFKRHEPHPR